MLLHSRFEIALNELPARPQMEKSDIREFMGSIHDLVGEDMWLSTQVSQNNLVLGFDNSCRFLSRDSLVLFNVQQLLNAQSCFLLRGSASR